MPYDHIRYRAATNGCDSDEAFGASSRSIHPADAVPSYPPDFTLTEVEFAENLTAGQNKKVTIEGGYNGAYTENSGYTLLKGILTLKSGTLELENLVVK